MLLVKAFHIIFMVTWFAGLFYLPRLFVYHVGIQEIMGQERFKIMERKLFIIMSIGALGTLVLGLWLLWAYAWQQYHAMAWLHIKLFLAVLLIGFHIYLGLVVRQFAADRPPRSEKYYRLINEVPAIALLAMVILAVVKPG